MESNDILTDDTIIWRYMNLESFMSLISYKKLSFCRFDRFKSIDPYEGANSKYELEQQDFILHMLSHLGQKSGNILLQKTKLIKDLFKETLEDINKQYFINSWHINDVESVAMWDSFTHSKTGIAIKTTLGKLKNSLDNTYDFKYKKVQYIDLKTYKGDIHPLLRKTKYFEHEKELRVYFEFINENIEEPYEISIAGNKTYGMSNRINNPDRKDIPIAIDELIDELIISPKSEEWFYDLIAKILKDYNFQIMPKESDIKYKNIKIKSGEYSLINTKNEFMKLIENSSLEESAKNAIYNLKNDKKE